MRLLMLLLLTFRAFGQGVYSGSAQYSGAGWFSGGAPLTYPARTDNCFSGAESQCPVPGTGLVYLNRSTDTVPTPGTLANGAYLYGMNTIITDPDFGTKMVRATDYSLNATYGQAFNLGSAGTPHRWSSDSKKLLINSTGNQISMLAFSADAMMTVSPTALYGYSDFPGAAYGFSMTDPHVLYELETDNPGGTYVNQLNKLTLNDSGAPSAWTYTRTKMFNFNWDGSADGTSSPHCLPAGYKSTWQGLFTISYDDTSFTIVWSDNGQSAVTGGSCANSPGGTCTGPVYVTNYTVGKGCRMYNSMTGQISGDWGASGYAVNGQSADANGNPLLDASTVLYQDYNVLHEAQSTPNPDYAALGNVQQANGSISSVSADGLGHTTITMANSVKYNSGQRIWFYSMDNASNTWLNCTGTPCNSTPWTITQGTSGSPATIVIDDRVAGVPHAAYGPAAESPAGVFAPAGLCTNTISGVAYGYFCNVVYWHIPTLTMEPGLSSSSQGHSALGYVNDYRAKYYTAHTVANPSLPCLVSPAVPCPGASELQLLPQQIADDQHGSYLNSGTADQTPVFMVTTHVCGMAPGNTGAGGCPSPYTSLWSDEIIAIENFIARPSGADCNYGSGATGCVYRLGHTFNTGDNWNFNIQNAVGIISPGGKWLAFPSTWGNTLGCMDGTTNCWSGYVASGPPTASGSTTTVTTDASSNVTVNVSNQFCAPGATGAGGVPCGTLPEQITFSGFNESWMNAGTLTITATGGCVSGTCTSFTGTLSGAPAPANYTGATEPTTAKAIPVECTGSAAPCQRGDIWIASLMTAH